MQDDKGNFEWQICHGCRGEGTRVHEALREFNDEYAAEDPDYAESYFSGGYDVCCEDCDGSGKVKDYYEYFNADAECADCDMKFIWEDAPKRSYQEYPGAGYQYYTVCPSCGSDAIGDIEEELAEVKE